MNITESVNATNVNFQDESSGAKPSDSWRNESSSHLNLKASSSSSNTAEHLLQSLARDMDGPFGSLDWSTDLFDVEDLLLETSASNDDEDPTTSENHPHDSSNSSIRPRPRSVHFGSVTIRTYPMIIGDNPSCSEGIPLTIAWEYDECQTFPLKQFELLRSDLRSTDKKNLVLSPRRRRAVVQETPLSPASPSRPKKGSFLSSPSYKKGSFLSSPSCKKGSFLTSSGRSSPTKSKRGRISSGMFSAVCRIPSLDHIKSTTTAAKKKNVR